MRQLLLTTCGVILALSATFPARCDDTTRSTTADHAAAKMTSPYWDIRLSTTQPQFVGLSLDSLGKQYFRPNSLRRPAAGSPAVLRQTGQSFEYRGAGVPNAAPARWTFTFAADNIRLLSRWSPADPPEPVVLNFDLDLCHATLLGKINADGSVTLPALLHMPDQGTLRISTRSKTPIALGYKTHRKGIHAVTVTFPPATKERPEIEYQWDVVTVYPKLAGIEGDARFDGFRRNWLNALQLQPYFRTLANHAASDTCAMTYYGYAEIARHSPPLADGVTALDLVRQTLDRSLEGMPTYGMPGYKMFDWNEASLYPQISLDTYPSLLITAMLYFDGTNDAAWLKNNYDGLRKWAEKVLVTDRDGNGLCEYHASGNSGSWSSKVMLRPANAWDTIGFGHEDAFSNALAYRGLRGMQRMAEQLGKSADAARYQTAADRLRDAYYKTFYSPATGVLAGWKSADGQLHDYYFLFVNGMAIHYGLVPTPQANAIMDRLLAKMKEVGFQRFEYGLPGNLIPIARKDYVHLERRWGGGEREDNADGFQIYTNGGATGCCAYFTLAALYDLGRREEADAILFSMLKGYEDGNFQGRDPKTRMSYDWRAWDGTPWGYEGFLADNYLPLLAVLNREGIPAGK